MDGESVRSVVCEVTRKHFHGLRIPGDSSSCICMVRVCGRVASVGVGVVHARSHGYTCTHPPPHRTHQDFRQVEAFFLADLVG